MIKKNGIRVVSDEYAEGGLTEHGLKINDKIVSGKIIGTTIRVRNENLDEDARIDLNTGKRTLLTYDSKLKKWVEKMAKEKQPNEEKIYSFEVAYAHAPRNKPQISDRSWVQVSAKTEKEAYRNAEKSIRLMYKYETPPHVFSKISPILRGVQTLEESIQTEKRRYEEQLERIKNESNPQQFRKGGKIGFEALANKVAKRYVNKKVSKEYQSEYGKTYDAKEAKEVGNKVAAKVYRQQKVKYTKK